ncbi:MAG: sterol desaturase family protein [Caulobacteraceae bacterium]|nr:sterol desaturase family protein [Caulobacteraceae bacterium]
MQGILAFVRDVADLDSGLVWTLLFFIALETIAPRPGLKVSTASRVRALVFWSVYNAAIVLLFYLIQPLWHALSFKPLIPSLAPTGLPRPVAIVIGCVAAAYVGDFVYYWCHRFQHRFLWRFHAVHHSVREMSGITAYHHFSEEVTQFVLYVIPLSIFTRDPYSIPILGLLLGLQGSYLHSQTRTNFGKFGRYFSDNRFHRIHHSIEPRHFHKNFGIFTTLWDSVFGTAYFPVPGEWPQTGVADFPEPASVREFLLSPFTYRKGAPEAPTETLAHERA